MQFFDAVSFLPIVSDFLNYLNYILSEHSFSNEIKLV